MAPEIIEGDSNSNACDFWSIGIIIFKFFAEFSPFSAGDQHELLYQIVEEEITYPENFPSLAKDLCKGLLEKNPLKRLGAGSKGSENDTFALKSHSFFEGIDFDSLINTKSPISQLMKRQSSLKQKIIAKYKTPESVKAKEASLTALP
jgi:serine/threonine protein kinase